MRRVATLTVAIGLTVTVIGTGGAIRREAPGQPVSPAQRAGLAGSAGPAGPAGTKVVRFGGYAIDVPASWPVYRLDRDPARCVRYDRHAVYLGTPGSDQSCPAHLVGRVATISLEPGGPAGQSGPQPAGPLWGPAASGLSLGHLQAGGVLLQDPLDHQFWGAYGHQALTVTATYGAGPAQAARIIRTLRWLGPSGPAGAVLTRAARQDGPAALSRHRPARRVMRGFDTCATPSLRTMRKWRRAFSAMAIYIGGPEAGCRSANLTAAWVRSATAMGWSLIPTYVGRQAPCTRFQVRIRKGHARVQGKAAARNAIALAASLGIGRGAPIYDDMENYNTRRGICRRQVLSFLNGWTRELHRRGYRSGVYSSAGSGATNLGRTSRIYQWRLAKPNSMWFALWDGRANLHGWPYLLPSWWSGRHRLKQWMGSHRRRVGGVALNIDSDMVDGAVYR